MTTDREAMQMALDVLIDAENSCGIVVQADALAAILALQVRLAEPEPEIDTLRHDLECALHMCSLLETENKGLHGHLNQIWAELNFCWRCGEKSGPDGHIHTCTPPEPCDHHWSDPTKTASKLAFCFKCGTLQKEGK